MESNMSLRDLIKHEGLTQIDVDVFMKNDFLGEGQFGKVYPGIVVGPDRIIIRAAIKMLKNASEEIDMFVNEIRIMEKLNHPGVVRFLKSGRTNKEQHVYVAMERLQMDLRQILKNYPTGIKEADARIYFSEICAGIKYLHDNQVCHRDIKPDNIMTDENENLKICDFGLATRVSDGQTFSTDMRSTTVGTIPYLSPQLIMTEKYRGDKADVFALGKTLLYLLTGVLSDTRHIKDKASPQGQAQLLQIFKANVKIPTNLSQGVRSLLEQMLHPSEEKRPTMNEVCAHSWINDRQDINMTCSMMQSNLNQSRFGSQMKFNSEPVNQQKLRIIHDLMASLRKETYQKLAAYVKTVTETLKYISRGDVSLSIERFAPIDTLRYIRYFEIACSLTQLASAEFVFSCGEEQTVRINLLKQIFEANPAVKTDLESWKDEASTSQQFKNTVEGLQIDQIPSKVAGLWTQINANVQQTDQMNIFCPQIPNGADVQAFWLGELGINSCRLRIEVQEEELAEYLLSKELTKLDIKEIKFHLMSLCRKGKVLDCLKEKTRDNLAFLIPKFDSLVTVKFELDKIYKVTSETH